MKILLLACALLLPVTAMATASERGVDIAPFDSKLPPAVMKETDNVDGAPHKAGKPSASMALILASAMGMRTVHGPVKHAPSAHFSSPPRRLE